MYDLCTYSVMHEPRCWSLCSSFYFLETRRKIHKANCEVTLIDPWQLNALQLGVLSVEVM